MYHGLGALFHKVGSSQDVVIMSFQKDNMGYLIHRSGCFGISVNSLGCFDVVSCVNDDRFLISDDEACVD
jgi:hypothetical protein